MLRTRPGLSISPGSSAGQKRWWKRANLQHLHSGAEFRVTGTFIHPWTLLGCIFCFNTYHYSFSSVQTPVTLNTKLKLYGFYGKGFYPHLLTFKPWPCQKISVFQISVSLGLLFITRKFPGNFDHREKKKYTFLSNVYMVSFQLISPDSTSNSKAGVQLLKENLIAKMCVCLPHFKNCL